MNNIETTWGSLAVREVIECDEDARPLVVIPEDTSTLQAPWGQIALFAGGDAKQRRPVPRMELYPNGQPRAVPTLTDPAIPTPVGTIAAERVLFHRDGSLKRVFPLQGELNAYWTYADEWKYAQPIPLQTPIGSLSARWLSIGFYPSGALRDLLLWPDETLSIPTPFGEASVHLRIGFFEDGPLRHFEPATPLDLSTPIGVIPAYDPSATALSPTPPAVVLGQTAGQIESCRTVHVALVLTHPDGTTQHLRPPTHASYCDETATVTAPLALTFGASTMTTNLPEAQTIDLTSTKVRIERLGGEIQGDFVDCR